MAIPEPNTYSPSTIMATWPSWPYVAPDTNSTWTYAGWPYDYVTKTELQALRDQVDDALDLLNELRAWLIAHDGAPVTNPTRPEDV